MGISRRMFLAAPVILAMPAAQADAATPDIAAGPRAEAEQEALNTVSGAIASFIGRIQFEGEDLEDWADANPVLRRILDAPRLQSGVMAELDRIHARIRLRCSDGALDRSGELSAAAWSEHTVLPIGWDTDSERVWKASRVLLPRDLHRIPRRFA